MPKFPNSVHDWGTDSFKQTLKGEIEQLKSGTLPLEKSISQGGHVDDSNITASILNITESPAVINVKAGIFFTEVVGGCNCNDDPVEINAYCEMILNIDKLTAETKITVIPD